MTLLVFLCRRHFNSFFWAASIDTTKAPRGLIPRTRCALCCIDRSLVCLCVFVCCVGVRCCCACCVLPPKKRRPAGCPPQQSSGDSRADTTRDTQGVGREEHARTQGYAARCVLCVVRESICVLPHCSSPLAFAPPLCVQRPTLWEPQSHSDTRHTQHANDTQRNDSFSERGGRVWLRSSARAPRDAASPSLAGRCLDNISDQGEGAGCKLPVCAYVTHGDSMRPAGVACPPPSQLRR